MPRFSIVMPTFRREHVIHRTIQTIRSQSFTNWELIVVDNAGSNYAFEDPRIRCFVHTDVRGAGAARNFGIGKITGELVCFFDDDDLMYPTYLETFDRVFQDPKVKMARCGMHCGPEGSGEDWSFATPEVVMRSSCVQPTWDSGECHDQRYFDRLAGANRVRHDQIQRIPEILLRATSDPQGGLRDPEGHP